MAAIVAPPTPPPRQERPLPEVVAHPPASDAEVESSYFRSVAISWLIGVPVMAAIITAIILAVGDVGVGGAIAVGVCSGIWASPLAGVIGIGIWYRTHHGPHG